MFYNNFKWNVIYKVWRRQWHPSPVLLPGKSHGWRTWKAAVHGVAEGQTRLSDFPFTFYFHALEKEIATHSSVLAWRIPGTAEPGGLLSMGSHRVRHDWSDLAIYKVIKSLCYSIETNIMLYIYTLINFKKNQKLFDLCSQKIGESYT